jgi:hypothetical protein
MAFPRSRHGKVDSVKHGIWKIGISCLLLNFVELLLPPPTLLSVVNIPSWSSLFSSQLRRVRADLLCVSLKQRPREVGAPETPQPPSPKVTRSSPRQLPQSPPGASLSYDSRASFPVTESQCIAPAASSSSSYRDDLQSQARKPAQIDRPLLLAESRLLLRTRDSTLAPIPSAFCDSIDPRIFGHCHLAQIVLVVGE